MKPNSNRIFTNHNIKNNHKKASSKIASIGLVAFMLLNLSTLKAQEFTHPKLLSFEENAAPLQCDPSAVLKTTTEHYKHGAHSASWKWNKPSAQLTIPQPIGYLKNNPDPKDNSLSTFIFWVYGKKALEAKTLRFEFLKNNKVCCWFDYGLNFTGWRGAWIAFDRDMQGTPQDGMDELRVTAPNVNTGELLFDHIILSSYQDVRQHTADFQAPYINQNTKNHWLILNKSWANKFDLPVKNNINEEELIGLRKVEENLTKQLLPKNGIEIEKLRKRFQNYGITPNPDGSVTGKPIFFERYAETYYSLGGIRNTTIFNPLGQSLKQANDLLLDLAHAYHRAALNENKEEIAAMFVLFTKHLTDQGFTAGSAMGTLHHLGYNMRDYYPAMFLMKDVLIKAGLDQSIQQSMEWFSGTGEVKLKPSEPGIDIDAFNTSLIGRLSSILMLKDSPEKATYLKSFSRWADNGLRIAPGLSPAIKPDGTLYHHSNHYPAYAIGGTEGAVAVVSLLSKTTYAISQEGHENLKKALLAMRFYCNLTEWPLSLSGRHPDGTGKLIPEHFSQLALAGSPDGKEKIDKELASAYMRLTQEKKDAYTKIFTSQGLQPELAPVGNRTFPYSCLSIHRRGDWMVSFRGFSRYLWNSETYETANLYGRYLDFGNMQIMASGKPVSNSASGFRQEGWDWNHWWGTTAMVLPMEQLKANVLNVDTFSGIEEMLLSDESYAGGVSLANEQGVFAMKLHDHDKYNGKLRARKSWFMFDNRIIALGSNIKNESKEFPVETTLFQEENPTTKDSILINNKVVSAFPFKNQISGNSTLSDAHGNAYFVKNGNVRIERKEQHSLDQKTSKPTTGNFTTAVLSHGYAPSNGSYEYAVLIQPTQKEINSFEKAKPYKVLRCDSIAHIVNDKTAQTTGYAFFEAGKSNLKTEILTVSLPCLLMTRREGKSLRLSASDPDLRFYEGPADEKFDTNGKQIERSIYSRDWIKNESKESKLQIEVAGIWNIKIQNPNASVVRTTKTTTIIAFKCREGMTREVVLTGK
jgi:chondroitin-sulfate-ABC endolyase/exolyase